MPYTRKKSEITKPLEEKKSGVTLSVTITDEQYSQMLHTAEVQGYPNVNDWFLDVITDSI